jgi:hypothetical protein
MLLGLSRVLLAPGVVILPMGFSGSTMGLCRSVVMFRRLVVRVFHVDFSCWPENFGT